jgi:hypothetical protein
MKNIDKYVNAIKNDYSIDTWSMSHQYKDICLKNYTYTPRLNSANQIIPEWTHRYKEKTLTVDDIRKRLTRKVFKRLSQMQADAIGESVEYDKYSDSDDFDRLQRKIKDIASLCIWIHNGNLFRAFIDNYRMGYLN